MAPCLRHSFAVVSASNPASLHGSTFAYQQQQEQRPQVYTHEQPLCQQQVQQQGHQQQPQLQQQQHYVKQVPVYFTQQSQPLPAIPSDCGTGCLCACGGAQVPFFVAGELQSPRHLQMGALEDALSSAVVSSPAWSASPGHDSSPPTFAGVRPHTPSLSTTTPGDLTVAADAATRRARRPANPPIPVAFTAASPASPTTISASPTSSMVSVSGISAMASLRGKLQDMSLSFMDLGGQVEEEKQQRTERLKKRNQDIFDSQTLFKRSILEETRTREQGVVELQVSVDALLSSMMDRFQGRIMQRFERLLSAVDRLGERCVTLQRGIQQFKGEIPSRLRLETGSLMRSIGELAADFERERQLCAERDAQCARRIKESEFNVDQLIQAEASRAERCAESLQELIEEFGAGDTNVENQRRRSVVAAELAELKAAFKEELHSREECDDKVVEAINDYTDTLHRNLRRAHLVPLGT